MGKDKKIHKNDVYEEPESEKCFIQKYFRSIAVFIVILLCSFAIFTVHASDTASPKASCNSSCHSHGQNVAVNNLASEEDEDDNEPAPPLVYWLQTPISLLSLYTIPIIGVLWFVSKQRKIYLTSQLRF